MKIQNKLYAIILGAVAALAPAVSQAEVTKQSDTGFLVQHIEEVKASPEELWKRLIKPKGWWNKQHSWSGSVDGFSIDPVPGGCFCETISEENAEGAMIQVGSVEHMRVIHAHKGRVLRMQGALGPLQSEAVLGTFTVAIEPHKEKEGVSKVSFNYIVGGYMRFPADKMSAAVDGVIGQQFFNFLAPFEAPSDAVKDGQWKLDIEGLFDEGGAPVASDGKDASDKKVASDKKDGSKGGADVKEEAASEEAANINKEKGR